MTEFDWSVVRWAGLGDLTECSYCAVDIRKGETRSLIVMKRWRYAHFCPDCVERMVTWLYEKRRE